MCRNGDPICRRGAGACAIECLIDTGGVHIFFFRYDMATYHAGNSNVRLQLIGVMAIKLVTYSL